MDHHGDPDEHEAGVDQRGPERGITTPDEPTHEATTPPGRGQGPDADLVERAREQLKQAGGGH